MLTKPQRNHDGTASAAFDGDSPLYHGLQCDCNTLSVEVDFHCYQSNVMLINMLYEEK